MPVKRSAGGSSSTQKRTRFDPKVSSSEVRATSTASSGEEYDMLEEDLPEGAAREKSRAKKQLKDQDGYGSDSSNDDDEGVVPSRRPKKAGEGEEDDDVDMFADDVDEKQAESAKDKGKGKGKEKEFMDISEIEGQEFGRSTTAKRNGDEDDDEDSEEDDVDESGRKKTKGEGLDGDMGSEITPFNMKSEMTEGRFTTDGEAYEENEKDPNEKHDMWLDDLDKDEIKKARKAHRERERLEKEREEKEASLQGKEAQTKLLRDAVGLMERGETILEALQRLGIEVEEKKKKEERESGGKKKSWAERQKERKKLMAADQEQADPMHTSNPFTNLSNIVSSLTTIGHLDVYSLSKESIQRMLPSEPRSANGNGSGATSGSGAGVSSGFAPPPPPTDKRMFSYRFSLGYVRNLPEFQRPVEREVFGPFPVQQLKQWRNTGFFGGPACENVELRLAEEGVQGSFAASWGSWADVVGP